ncbi:hypothetical protein K491DRAFT_703191 [Lophiostoma macrostomum CBS 122681]|uniref:Cytochrome b-c1 complex subunit 6, mitochondrial n=1 Tax=Lophiostoma macrostomum CBS 122681 TaxID=1314788 RepID=A0A6A6TGA6_9PLEO|nr:hypothetical protein K491DRAFT_703191 [Lophiostoma macrostomum CBS 122681]
MLPKPTPSFPSPSPTPSDAPPSNVQPGVPYSDLAEPDTIAIISQPSGQSCAVVGGIMAARMRHLGVRGVIVDGRVRDLDTLRGIAHDVPIWAKGTSVVGAGAQTRFHAKDVEVCIGEVRVRAGDVVMIDGEERGAVVVPRERVEEVLGLVGGLVGADERVMRDVEGGGSVATQLRTMGITDFFSAAWDTFSQPSPDAEAPPQGGSSTESPASGDPEESKEEEDVNKADAKGDEDSDEQGHKPSVKPSDEEKDEGGDDEEGGDEGGEEEEEEEEETVDPKEQLEEDCKKSKDCSPAKHHYDECAERVTGQIESDGKAKEDCVEEFFHLAHCATQCAAPKLWSELK